MEMYPPHSVRIHPHRTSRSRKIHAVTPKSRIRLVFPPRIDQGVCQSWDSRSQAMLSDGRTEPGTLASWSPRRGPLPALVVSLWVRQKNVKTCPTKRLPRSFTLVLCKIIYVYKMHRTSKLIVKTCPKSSHKSFRLTSFHTRVGKSRLSYQPSFPKR